MSARAQALADDFEHENDELIRLVEGLSDAQWATRTEAEGWTVAAVARHVAAGIGIIRTRVQAVAAGQPPGFPSVDEIHASNADDAIQYATVPRAEVLELLRTNGAALASLVRGLSDAQLDRSLALPNGQTTTLAGLVGTGLVGHLRSHGGSIRAAVGL